MYSSKEARSVTASTRGALGQPAPARLSARGPDAGDCWLPAAAQSCAPPLVWPPLRCLDRGLACKKSALPQRCHQRSSSNSSCKCKGCRGLAPGPTRCTHVPGQPPRRLGAPTARGQGTPAAGKRAQGRHCAGANRPARGARGRRGAKRARAPRAAGPASGARPAPRGPTWRACGRMDRARHAAWAGSAHGRMVGARVSRAGRSGWMLHPQGARRGTAAPAGAGATGCAVCLGR